MFEQRAAFDGGGYEADGIGRDVFDLAAAAGHPVRAHECDRNADAASDHAAREPRPLARLEAELTELAGHLNAATHRWLMLLAEFDRREGWADGAIRSCAHWLAWKCGIDRGAAREKVRVARALEALPSISAAMERGELSYSKVRALTRVATPATEETLLMIAQHGTADHVERVVRAYRRVQEAAELSREARQHAGRSLTWRHDDDGTVLLQVRLTAEAGALVLRALQAAERGEADADGRVSAETRRRTGDACHGVADAEHGVAEYADTPAQRRADALVRLAESWLATGEHALAGGERQAIVVHVDASVLAADVVHSASATHPARTMRLEGSLDPAGRCELEHGPALAAETARRLACDASLAAIVEDGEGRALDVGRARRTVPAALARALRARDDGRCRYPGCTHRHGLDAHHVRHWAHGGATRLSNLVLLCRRHHRLVHEGGVRIERLDDSTLRFVDARGRTIEAAPPTAGSVAHLLASNFAHGIRIDPGTAVGRWSGEDLDLGMAIDGLWWRHTHGAGPCPAT